MSTANLYGISDLGHFGLGHRLLAWARCVIWCQENAAQMLAPNWLGIPIGPWLRKEPDKRLYFQLFRSDAYISGWRRLRVLAFASRIEALDLPKSTAPTTKLRLVIFRNATSGDADRFFPTFLGHHQLLLSELIRMTRPQFRPQPPSDKHVAIHVRMGDFGKASTAQIKAGAHSVRLPVDWYGDLLLGIRERLGSAIPAVVYSDGTDDDLRPLLTIPNVRRSPPGSAVTHMLGISQAAILIGSGSGMSLWGSFLGQVPRLCFPGQKLLHTFAEDGWEPECESASAIPASFVSSIRARVCGA